MLYRFKGPAIYSIKAFILLTKKALTLLPLLDACKLETGTHACMHALRSRLCLPSNISCVI
jgi:hypothetical protein